MEGRAYTTSGRGRKQGLRPVQPARGPHGKAACAGFAALLLMTAAALPAQKAMANGDGAAWVLGPWTRASMQPVIRPDKAATFADPVSGATVHWEALHTFNPAAVVREGKVYVLYRAEDDSGNMAIGGHVSRLGLAVSSDGVHFTQEPQPVFYPAKDAQLEREIEGGTEDPRIVEAPDGTYVLTYTQWSRRRGMYSIGLATSRDLRHWTKQGPIFSASTSGGAYENFKYKSSGIVTEVRDGRVIAAKINGKFWMFWGEIQVHLATSDDLVHWTPVETAPGVPKVVLERRAGLPDSAFPETGPPPLLTPRGIVMLYNAKNSDKDDADPKLARGAYSVEEALWDAHDPTKLLARTVRPVFEPQAGFERSGQYKAGTTFAEGLVLFQGKWWMYYGCADSFVGVATAPARR